jgi:hypothetical protein
MARRKKTEADPTQDPSSDLHAATDNEGEAETVAGIAGAPPVVEIPVQQTQQPVAAAKERITVVLDGRGGLDVAGMRDSTKTKLIAALKKSSGELLPKLPEGPVTRWPDIAVRAIYSFLGAAEIQLASKRFPPEVATAAFTYTDEDMKVLMDPTQAVLAKHAGKLDRWQEETTLVLAISQVHFAKLHALKKFMAEYQERNARPVAPRQGPSPIVEEDKLQ